MKQRVCKDEQTKMDEYKKISLEDVRSCDIVIVTTAGELMHNAKSKKSTLIISSNISVQ